MKSIKLYKGLLIGLFLLILGLTFNRHHKANPFTYHSEIWADRAGYYVHLPAFFIYGYGNEFPSEYSDKTGKGFWFTQNKSGDKKVFSKYPIGVAILQGPFFLAAHFLSILTSQEANGFSLFYHKSIIVAACFYGLMACLLLFKVLTKRGFSPKTSFFAILIALLGTNLFHYIYDDPGMSHVYSLFLFSGLIYLDSHFTGKTSNFIFLGLLMGLICLVRPVNVAFTPLILLFLNNWKTLIERYLSPQIFISILVFALSLLPQINYNYYLTGKITMSLYDGESFPYLTSPKFLDIWFAPDNGLFLYNPIYLIGISGCIFLTKVNKLNPPYALLTFALLSYIYASWWSTNLGCGYGNRAFVEYNAIWVFGFANVLVWQKKHAIKVSFILLTLVLYNLVYTYSFDECYYGTGIWDYKSYFYVLLDL